MKRILHGLTQSEQRMVDLAHPLADEFTANTAEDWVAIHSASNALVIVARGAAANKLRAALDSEVGS